MLVEMNSLKFVYKLICCVCLSSLLACGGPPKNRPNKPEPIINPEPAPDPLPAPSVLSCSDFSDNEERCNIQSDPSGKKCHYSILLKACVVKEIEDIDKPVVTNTPVKPPVDTHKNPQTKEEKEQAINEAHILLKDKTISNFCKAENIRSNVHAQNTLFEAIRLLLSATDDKAAFCAHEYDLLDSEFFLTSPNQKCIDTLLEACMYPKSYGQKFLSALTKLQSTNSDAKYITSLIRDLVNQHGPQMKYSAWGVKNVARSYLNDESWILDSPRYDDIERTKLDPNQHSDNFVSSWSNTIATAEQFVDITSLAVPEDKFMDELKKALRTLDSKNKTIIVRLLFGANIKWINLDVDVWKVFKELSDELSSTTKVKLYVGSFASSELFATVGQKYFSWNHSKVVAVDGKWLITGGHNLYRLYLNQTNPVHDISVKLPGKIAELGHRFCDYLWKYTVDNSSSWLSRYSISKYGNLASNQNDNDFRSFSFQNSDQKTSKLGEPIVTDVPPDLPDYTKVIAAGRLSNAFMRTGREYYNVADTAKMNMIHNAQTAIFISQQAIYPIILANDFNKNVIENLIRAMYKDVDVFIIKSSTKTEIAGKVDLYNSGLSRIETFKYFFNIAKNMVDSPKNRETILAKLFDHFLVLDSSNGLAEVPNHAKLLIVDTKASSVGSHNLYDDSHAEFEVILRNMKLLLDYYAGYWFSSFSNVVALQQPTNFSDYKIGDYVFLQRNRDTANARRGWTLGKIVDVKDDAVDISLDFLIEEDANMITIDDPKLLWSPSSRN